MVEELLTVEEVAGYLKIDRITVYRMLARRKIPAFKVGGQWRFYRKMIDAWLIKNSNIPRGYLH
jgi:excisionase family DNA binding protein